MSVPTPLTADTVLKALHLTPATRIQESVNKATLKDQASTPAERRLIEDGVHRFTWVANLNPLTAALPAGPSNFSCIVGHLQSRTPVAKASLVRLLHRLVPDPLLLLTSHDQQATNLTLARTAAELTTCPLIDCPAFATTAFLTDLSLAPATDLDNLHHRWRNALVGLNAARRTGAYVPHAADPHAVAQLTACDAVIKRLTQEAIKARQAADRARLNAEIASQRHQRALLVERLTQPRA